MKTSLAWTKFTVHFQNQKNLPEEVESFLDLKGMVISSINLNFTRVHIGFALKISHKINQIPF